MNQETTQDTQSEAEATAAANAATMPILLEGYANADVAFHFRKDKETGQKRPSVHLVLPQLDVNTLVNIINEGGKGLEMLLAASNDVIIEQARGQVAANATMTQADLDVSKLDWNFIANLPKAERTGGGIAKDTWEAFGEDYKDVMLAATGKPAEAIENHVKFLMNKFAVIKTNKKVLAFMKDMLTTYFEATPNKEEFAACVEFLSNKADTLLAADESALLLNL